MNEESGVFPLTYLITIRAYGTWLHGDEKGSAGQSEFNVYGSPQMPQSDKLETFMRQEMREQAVLLNRKQREAVLLAIKKVCSFRDYELLAINVRTNSCGYFGSNQARKKSLTNLNLMRHAVCVNLV